MMRRALWILIAFLALGAIAPVAAAQENVLPEIEDGSRSEGGEPEELPQPIRIVLILTALAVAPAILMTVTSFTRIVIVLSFVRKALSLAELPPNQVLIGLSLFLTVVAMNPVLTGIWEEGVQPYMDEEITLKQATDVSLEKLHAFMRKHTHEEEITLFLDITNTEPPETPEAVPITVMIPAFAMSELKIAFKMGFLIYIPFLVVDIVVASILLSMGMFMLPPVIISTPFKILLFIMVDGWGLVIKSLMESFEVPL